MISKVITEESIAVGRAERLAAGFEDGRRLLACIQCGTCTGTCPASTGMDITPRQVFRMAQLGMIDELMESRTLWQCATCASCKVKCPRGIPLSDLMLELRREYVRQRGAPEAMGNLARMLDERHNLTGDPPDNRLLWSLNMDPVPDGLDRRKGAQVVYFTGCVAGLFPAVSGIPQSLATLLRAARVDFTTLGGDEWCCGFPLFGAGVPERAQAAARHNVDEIRRLGPSTMVTSCPSCYHTFVHKYESLIGESLGFRVVHSTEFLRELASSGRLPLGTINEVVTYHDPCDLGRKSGIYDAPRDLINMVPGMEFREMRYARENAKCCGGGGNLEMNDKSISESIAEQRVAQAAETGARILLSACQQCKRTLQSAARRARTKIKVVDLTELLVRSVEVGQAESGVGAP
ncbi:MAG: (Fe-S)-binding protein [Firmicutes bacterium]|jgi:heterodisulfide reductase subunit D|nr:(Fe-S)-binding protein [Bacillota bacterium]